MKVAPARVFSVFAIACVLAGLSLSVDCTAQAAPAAKAASASKAASNSKTASNSNASSNSKTASNSKASPTSKAFALKPNEELDLSYELETHRKANLRICTDYVIVDLPEHHMIIVAKAPSWDVEAISPVRKMIGVSTCKEWVRRGSPFNFLKVTSIPEWPLVRTGTSPFSIWQATHYVLPFKTHAGAPVPISRGKVGDFAVLGEGVLPKQACQIVSTLIQTPKSVDGLPVQLNLWETEKTSSKMNSLFLFSGVNQGGPKEVEAKQVAIVKRHGVPSTEGYKVCKDPRDVWVSNADTEGFEGLMH